LALKPQLPRRASAGALIFGAAAGMNVVKPVYVIAPHGPLQVPANPATSARARHSTALQSSPDLSGRFSVRISFQKKISEELKSLAEILNTIAMHYFETTIFL
jgi:hypothetical protein